MCHHKEGALLIGDFAQFGEVADAALVALEAYREDVPHIGGDFHPVRNKHRCVLFSEGRQVPGFPHAVVFGDVDASQADTGRLGDEVIGVEH